MGSILAAAEGAMIIWYKVVLSAAQRGCSRHIVPEMMPADLHINLDQNRAFMNFGLAFFND